MFVTKLKRAAGALVAAAAVVAAVWAPAYMSSAVVDPPARPVPADLSGRWAGADWGDVGLKAVGPGAYAGTYTDTWGPGAGAITLTWSAEDRRFNGTWAQGKDRYGTVSVRSDGRDIRGAFTTDPGCKIRPGKPALADLHWVPRPVPRAGGAEPAAGPQTPGRARADVPTLTPEVILARGYAGEAVVEFRVGKAARLFEGQSLGAGDSAALYLAPKADGTTGGRVYVIVSWRAATRLRQLGIADPPGHFRGQTVRVAGTVRRLTGGDIPAKRTLFTTEGGYRSETIPGGTGPQYCIDVDRLDQLEVVHMP